MNPETGTVPRRFERELEEIGKAAGGCALLKSSWETLRSKNDGQEREERPTIKGKKKKFKQRWSARKRRHWRLLNASEK